MLTQIATDYEAPLLVLAAFCFLYGGIGLYVAWKIAYPELKNRRWL